MAFLCEFNFQLYSQTISRRQVNMARILPIMVPDRMFDLPNLRSQNGMVRILIHRQEI